ncbi:guanine nucleotide-binding protein subunit gamma 3 isoform X1 [Solanum dulcamara]|uniref:guanine nucleotide-binding protein subunit gamma 3 isoform X1 n=1 Tax=Solanum dulcamara TaxID=45834 RepID=UPI002485361D|nr:guanine nucleotide-binding protein subunit gamma 3 isoform X1 [Solanum dulcamara]
MAGAGCGGTASMPSMPPPRPKSPPQYPDLYGKRRELAKVQMLEREIGFLEEELKSIEGLHPASRPCKEVTEFVSEHSDPLIPTRIKKTRRSCCYWKRLCGSSCFNLSWICCWCRCPRMKMPDCCICNLCNCCPSISCSIPKCQCFSCPRSKCCSKPVCKWSCCSLKCPPCFRCSSCRPCTCTCSYPRCPKLNCSCCCKKCCCFCPCYFC